MATSTKARGKQRKERHSPVVAEVLEDGTIRMTETGRRADRDDSFALGQVIGEGWILWWQRRRMEDE